MFSFRKAIKHRTKFTCESNPTDYNEYLHLDIKKCLSSLLNENVKFSFNRSVVLLCRFCEKKKSIIALLILGEK